MAYNSIVNRTLAQPLIPEEVSNDMVNRVSRSTSAAAQLFRRIPVSQGQVRFPILSALPVAYWVTGDTGLKQTSEVAWDNKYLNIEELAVIVPVPENVIADVADDGNFDLWGEIQPDIEESIGRALDAAIFFGTNAPATFPDDVTTAATAAGNEYAEQAAQAAGGIQDDLDVVEGLVEADGFDASGIVAARSLKGRLRRARTTLGERLAGVNADITEYNGLPIAYPMRGLFPTGGGASGDDVRAFIGAFADEFVLGIRQDISLKILDQAVIQDGNGDIVYNLAQQDMVALRVTFRAGWQVSNRINYDQPVAAHRYPVGVLKY